MRSNPHPVGSFLHGIVGHESMAACHLEELLRCEWPQFGPHQPTIPLGRHGTSLAKSEKSSPTKAIRHCTQDFDRILQRITANSTALSASCHAAHGCCRQSAPAAVRGIVHLARL